MVHEIDLMVVGGSFVSSIREWLAASGGKVMFRGCLSGVGISGIVVVISA